MDPESRSEVKNIGHRLQQIFNLCSSITVAKSDLLFVTHMPNYSFSIVLYIQINNLNRVQIIIVLRKNLKSTQLL